LTRRAAAAKPDRWNLSHLIDRPVERFEEYLKDLDNQVSQFEAFRSRLSSDLPVDALLELLRLSERTAAASSKLGAYAYLWFSENTKDLEARTFKSKVEERLASLQNRTLFFDLWWQSVDQANAERLMAAAPVLRYHLETIRRFKPHTLSEPEEKIINLKNVTGRSAVNTLYDVVTNGFSFTLTVNGKAKKLSREELSSYVRHPQPRLRVAAYHELFRVFSANHDVLSEIYRALVSDWKSENLTLRGFATPISTRNLGNDVPDDAVETLLRVCAKNREVFQHYFRLKARICKIKNMSRYHVYAPAMTGEKRYRYGDAVKMVLEAYRSFSPRLAELAGRVIDENHLDAKVRPGKLSGAYCYSVVPGLTPYVMLNYTGEARDVATLAHELGHAVHGMMAERHSVFTFHSTLPLAETASVFGERILSDTLISNESNRRVKQALLMSQLDDIYATVQRQAYFVSFERSAHDMIAKGATAKDLANTYLAALREQFGKAVPVSDEFRWEWLAIPHLYASPFYCYAYSFGNLLVLALYRMYKEAGPTFVPKYLNLLAAGGSKSPNEILSAVGVDIRAEAFWQSGFDTIRSMVNELERTAA
jgi:oligoendopeptidase F